MTFFINLIDKKLENQPFYEWKKNYVKRNHGNNFLILFEKRDCKTSVFNIFRLPYLKIRYRKAMYCPDIVDNLGNSNFTYAQYLRKVDSTWK